MTIYRLIDGFTIGANSAKEFVSQLRNSSFYPCLDVHSYMNEFAKRAYIMYGKNIQCNDEDEFLDSLIQLNLVYIVEVN